MKATKGESLELAGVEECHWPRGPKGNNKVEDARIPPN